MNHKYKPGTKIVWKTINNYNRIGIVTDSFINILGNRVYHIKKDGINYAILGRRVKLYG